MNKAPRHKPPMSIEDFAKLVEEFWFARGGSATKLEKRLIMAYSNALLSQQPT